MIKNIKKLKWKKILKLIIIYMIILNFYKGYNPYLPSLPFYPNSKDEVKLVKKQINSRTQKDIDFFYLTNHGVHNAFFPHVRETKKELKKIILEPFVRFIVYSNKYIINRARPEQIDNSIKPLNKETSQTPAFPAGHALQAAVLCRKLSKKYPEKKELFKKIALECDYCRIKAGLHYPSDGEYSRYLVDLFYNN